MVPILWVHWHVTGHCGQLMCCSQMFWSLEQKLPSLFIEDNVANTVGKEQWWPFILYFQEFHKGRNCFSDHVDLEKCTKPQSHATHLYPCFVLNPYFVLNTFCEVLPSTPHCSWWMVLHLVILIHKFFWVRSMNEPQRKNRELGCKLKSKHPV